MGAPDAVRELVRRFAEHREAYRSGRYNETQLRREFLDPFFEALGWDVNNRQSYAEAYKEVIHEDAVKVGGLTKAPDYSFRIGGARKFFVEAKKPSISIKDDPAPAFQLRRYAWSAKLPLSILTDFDEFAVYDCRTRPDKTDKPSAGRILYVTADEYDNRWEEVAGVFAREAVLKGSFDRFAAAGAGAKRGTTSVDAAFLAEIEGWRDLLARGIALRNPDLSQPELNFAVQRTIDRIIFLRICEDRGIEDYGALLALVNGENVYGRLRELYRRADERYNSGLFHFRSEKDRAEHPDTLTPRLAIDDKPLKEIIRGLYYPDSPYEFSVLPADILGQVYEQFLGKVIRLTAGHRAVVEEKPEVKKAGGVYYTPTYIVDYIVKNTVGGLLEGKTPKTAAALRILDPACGSGSFLIGAYQYLLDWHRDWYVAHDPAKWSTGRAPVLRQAQGGGWGLTTAERKRILVNNIYGVDIDSQAVEVTKLSLLLKVLEGENEETLARQLRMFHERALPDLGKNVKCGNSLIGPDFFDGRLTVDDAERSRINAFDWQAEFPEIFRRSPSPARGEGQGGGGFDAVIGNPPYVRIQTLKESAPLEAEYYKRRYRAASKGNYDIYVVFVERGLDLLSLRGRLGFILPHKFFNAKYGEPLRGLIAEGKHLAEVVHFGDQQVFKGATTYTCLMFLQREGTEEFAFAKVSDIGAWAVPVTDLPRDANRTVVTSASTRSISIPRAGTGEWNFTVGGHSSILDKCMRVPLRLKDVALRCFQGPITSADSVFLFKEHRSRTGKFIDVRSKELDEWLTIEASVLKKVVRSGDIGRYKATASALVLFPYEVRETNARLYTPQEMAERFPHAWAYLSRNRKLLEMRERGAFRDGAWYRFGRTQNLGMWEQQKLLVPYMITRLASYSDNVDALYFINVTTGGYGITVDLSKCNVSYLCGLLNSRLLDFILKNRSTNFHGGYYAANKQYIEQLPIRTIDFSDPADKRRHDEMVTLVERMLDLHKKLPAAHTDQEKTALQRQIADTDRRIDRLVYDLYGLTEDEIKIVEGTA